jgi:hypothetical protein
MAHTASRSRSQRFRDGNFLKIRHGTATIVDEDAVPTRHRDTAENTATTTNSISEQPRLSNELAQQARHDLLHDKTDEQVAKEALENEYIKTDVLENPALIDADSRAEAELKLDIMDGGTLDAIVDGNTQLSTADVKSQLGFEWVAKAGYNEHGANLAANINAPGTEADSTAAHAGSKSSGEGEGKGSESAVGDSSEATVTATEVATGTADTATETAGETTGELAGVETGMAIDTDAGTITTGGETASSGTASGASGTGDAGGTGTTGGTGGTGGT